MHNEADKTPYSIFAYWSVANPALTDWDYTKLLRQIWQANTSMGINGILAFDRGVFKQVVEGTPTHVSRIVANILADPRHHDIHVTNYRLNPERLYKSWTIHGFERFQKDAGQIPQTASKVARLAEQDYFSKDSERINTRMKAMVGRFDPEKQ